MKLIKYAAAILLGPLCGTNTEYGVSIGEAGFSQINAIFHSESELIPTIQRSKWYFKYLD